MFKEKFQDFIFYLSNDLGWTWIDLFINLMCYFEVYSKLLKNKEFKEELDVCNVAVGGKSVAEQNIPQNSLYCHGCPYRTKSKVADLFYGSQSSGSCYYLNNGDWTLSNPTDLLWDACKCCSISTNEVGVWQHEGSEDLTMQFTEFEDPIVESIQEMTTETMENVMFEMSAEEYNGRIS